MSRPDWHEYFLAIADAVALRADCSRRQVGAVIVDEENRIVSTGYNGSHPGGPSCLRGGCPRATSGVAPGSSYDTGPGSCVAVHAEANAVLFTERSRLRHARLYITTEPCEGCTKLIRNTPIQQMRWPDGVMYL